MDLLTPLLLLAGMVGGIALLMFTALVLGSMAYLLKMLWLAWKDLD